MTRTPLLLARTLLGSLRRAPERLRGGLDDGAAADADRGLRQQSAVDRGTRSLWSATFSSASHTFITRAGSGRGSHVSTRELLEGIERYIEATNNEPRPFVWTKSADEILASVARFCARTPAPANS